MRWKKERKKIYYFIHIIHIDNCFQEAIWLEVLKTRKLSNQPAFQTENVDVNPETMDSWESESFPSDSESLKLKAAGSSLSSNCKG